MRIRRIQGWALIISALISIYFFAQASFFGDLGDPNSRPYALREIVMGTVLLFGLPAIRSAQPQSKTWGTIGLVLMAIPVVAQISFNLIVLFAIEEVDLAMILLMIPSFFAYNLAPVVYLGYLLVGWLTVRLCVFPAWIGWLMVGYGLINTIWLLAWRWIPVGALIGPVVGILLTLAQAAALAGYGWQTAREKVS